MARQGSYRHSGREEGHKVYSGRFTKVIPRTVLYIMSCLFSFSGLLSDCLGETFTLGWDPSQGNVAGYILYYGTAPRNYDGNIILGTDVCSADVCKFQIELDKGTWYLALTSFDSSGNESDFSDELKLVVGGTDPVLLYPSGSITWIRGCSYPIVWANFKSSKLSLKMVRGGSTVATINKRARNTGSLMWTVAGKIPEGDSYQIQVTGSNERSLSDGDLTIVAPKVTYPATGLTLAKSDGSWITWEPDTFCGQQVDILLKRGARTVLIVASGVPNSGFYEWTPSPSLNPGNNYRLVIRSSTAKNCFGTSEQFSIK
jgi:hypothetical protein